MKVRVEPVNAIDFTQNIFNSLRTDYPGFDSWAEHVHTDPYGRMAFIATDETGQYVGIALSKQETSNGYSELPNRMLKISTFKVASAYAGQGLGKALLTKVLSSSPITPSYVEVFPQHWQVIEFFMRNGFMQLSERSSKGEVVLARLTAS